MNEILKILQEYENLTPAKRNALKEEIEKADKRRMDGCERLRRAILDDDEEEIRTEEEITAETKSILKDLISDIDEINKAGVSGIEFVYKDKKRGSYRIKREFGRIETIITAFDENKEKRILSYSVYSDGREITREVNVAQPAKSTAQSQNKSVKVAKEFFDTNADEISNAIMKMTSNTIKPIKSIEQFLKPSKNDCFL